MSKSSRWLFGLLLIAFLAVPLAMVLLFFIYIRARSSSQAEVMAQQAEVMAQRDWAVQNESQAREADAVGQARTSAVPPLPTEPQNLAGAGGLSSRGGMAGMSGAPSMMGGGMGMAPGTSARGPASPDQSAKLGWLEHVVRIDIEFEGFRSVRCAGLVVDSASGGLVIIVAPASAFAPVTGKLNGRVVTRAAGPLTISRPSIDERGAMAFGSAGAGMGGPGFRSVPVEAGGMGIGPAMGSGLGGMAGGAMPGGGYNLSQTMTLRDLRHLAGSGLVAFSFHPVGPPVRVLGDVPLMSKGDKLSCLSRETGLNTSVSVLATGVPNAEKRDVEQPPAADELVRLSDAPVPMGSLLLNEANQPVGMVVARRLADDGQTQHLYAAPLERVFEASRPFLQDADVASAEKSLDGPVPATGMMSKAPQDPEEQRFETASRALAQRIKTSPEEARPDLLTELSQLLDEHFDHRQQRRLLEIDELGGRLDKLRESHQKRQTNKAEILKRRLEVLIDTQADQPWDEPK